MRIGVRSRCQRGGVGRRLMNYMFTKYPAHLALDVNANNDKAISFYSRIGLTKTDQYITRDKVEFIKFETPAGYEPQPIIERCEINSSNLSTLPTAVNEEKKYDVASTNHDSDLET